MAEATKADREALFAAQRAERGWDDSETWSLDQSLARIILPRLRRFREVNNGCPCTLTEQGWSDVLGKMIRAFELHERGWWDLNGAEIVEAKRGLRLFARWYEYLWW